MDFLVLNWNTSAIEYYKRNGCEDLTIAEKWHLYRLPTDAMKQMAESGAGKSEGGSFVVRDATQKDCQGIIDLIQVLL